MTSDNKAITVICEGKTEVYFVKYVLVPYFYNLYGINVFPNDLKGRVTVDKIVNHIKKAQTKIVTTLVDYYGFVNPNNFSIEDLIADIKKPFTSQFIIPYIQMHEIEALWFSNIDKIAQKMNANDSQKQRLEQIVEDYPNPENINNSKETAPSKRLESIFKGYDKPRHGTLIAKEISIETYMQKCPRFRTWIEDIIKAINS